MALHIYTIAIEYEGDAGETPITVSVSRSCDGFEEGFTGNSLPRLLRTATKAIQQNEENDPTPEI